ncbi:MAG: prepilin-type N-terminal cleavage/methylation domain-containing protein [Thermodesulfobacteriota bacterium]|nr:prepilin-type N-terminal cleavage/methylation domain-containing protein [Thermodesulfobacteriota bacterium]
MQTLNNKGFTLIELLIVIAIFAIGTAIAIPNIMDMGRRNQVKTEARQLKDQLARAQATAIEQNTPIVIIFGANSYQIIEETVTDNCALDVGEVNKTVNLSSSNLSIPAIAPSFTDSLIQWDTRGYPRDKNGVIDDGVIKLTGDGVILDVNISLAGNINITRP